MFISFFCFLLPQHLFSLSGAKLYKIRNFLMNFTAGEEQIMFCVQGGAGPVWLPAPLNPVE